MTVTRCLYLCNSVEGNGIPRGTVTNGGLKKFVDEWGGMGTIGLIVDGSKEGLGFEVAPRL